MTSTIPTPHVIGHQRRILGAPDARGNPVETWGSAEPVRVHAISGPEGELAEPKRPGGRVGLLVHAPASLAGRVQLRDRMVIGNTAHAVTKVQDWTKGPWPFPAAGLEIHLLQVEGAPTT